MISHGGICRKTLNKIKILRHEITMINACVVEYEFYNLFTTQLKRTKYECDDEGIKEAIRHFKTTKEYIEWCKSEDYECVSLYIELGNDKRMFCVSWDTAEGWKVGKTIRRILKCLEKNL